MPMWPHGERVGAVYTGHVLDHAAERMFLHTVGGGYRFIHRRLQDDFASLSTPSGGGHHDVASRSGCARLVPSVLGAVRSWTQSPHQGHLLTERPSEGFVSVVRRSSGEEGMCCHHHFPL
jgi:hypothetical protein